MALYRLARCDRLFFARHLYFSLYLPSLKKKLHLFYKYKKNILHTWSVDFVFAKGFFDCPSDQGGVFLMPQMLQHVNTRIQHCNGVSDVLSSNSSTRVTSTWLENRILKTLILYQQLKFITI